MEREYIFATRDRLDLSYHMLRAVRDKRYKYIRNYYPENPYLLWDPVRNSHPVMQEMWRLHAEGKLEGDQLVMFQSPRPTEELYDVENDPYELNNLAENEAHTNVLKRMRETLTAWQSEFGDMGNISEEQMVAKWYPNGTQPQTASPLFIPINASNPAWNLLMKMENGMHRCFCNSTVQHKVHQLRIQPNKVEMSDGSCIQNLCVYRKVKPL